MNPLLAEDSLETSSLIFSEKQCMSSAAVVMVKTTPCTRTAAELQIRGGIEDNLKIIFLISQ